MRAQEEAEFAELAAAVSHRLLRMAYAVCGDRQLAEDAVQSVWVSAYRTWPRVRDVEQHGGLPAEDGGEPADELASPEVVGDDVRSGRVVEPSRASHENGVVEHELVWSAVGQLPPRQRAVIVLRYYEGMSEADIAETLGIRPGTVKSAASAAMARLRATLTETETE